MAAIIDAAQTEKQLVVFDLASEGYGVDIGAVREIIRMQEITRVPKTPEFVEGVINLRGKVIPVIDLRKRFGLHVAEQNKDNRIVVVDIGKQDIGVIVDAVTEVLRISTDSVEPPTSVITSADSDYLLGIAKLESRLIILLDLESVLSKEEKETLVSEDLE
ncbi:MAG: chemotaxis protein CheW [Chloroflexi bacterium]|nr:chemotaxis protein CheW [Chloroflexota bacterium]